jgi:hypothetical protein
MPVSVPTAKRGDPATNFGANRLAVGHFARTRVPDDAIAVESKPKENIAPITVTTSIVRELGHFDFTTVMVGPVEGDWQIKCSECSASDRSGGKSTTETSDVST